MFFKRPADSSVKTNIEKLNILQKAKIQEKGLSYQLYKAFVLSLVSAVR